MYQGLAMWHVLVLEGKGREGEMENWGMWQCYTSARSSHLDNVGHKVGKMQWGKETTSDEESGQVWGQGRRLGRDQLLRDSTRASRASSVREAASVLLPFCPKRAQLPPCHRM